MASGLVGARAQEGDGLLRREGPEPGQLDRGRGRLEAREVAPSHLRPLDLPAFHARRLSSLAPSSLSQRSTAPFFTPRGHSRITRTRSPCPGSGSAVDAPGRDTRRGHLDLRRLGRLRAAAAARRPAMGGRPLGTSGLAVRRPRLVKTAPLSPAPVTTVPLRSAQGARGGARHMAEPFVGARPSPQPSPYKGEGVRECLPELPTLSAERSASRTRSEPVTPRQPTTAAPSISLASALSGARALSWSQPKGSQVLTWRGSIR